MSTPTTPPTANARPSGSTRLPTLADLAQVPLHRFVSSCAISSDGTLGTVGCIGPKAEAAKKAGLLGLGVCDGQTYDDDAHVKGELVGDTTTEGLSVVHASTVGELLLRFIHRVGPEIYGSAQDLPHGLRDADIPLAPTQDALFDYHEKSFFPLKRLNELIGKALLGPATQLQGDISNAPPVKINEVSKFKGRERGYLFVLGTAGCGKTSWALDWVRYSRNQFSAPKCGARARLAGWYFARRYDGHGIGIGNSSEEVNQSQSEYWALQTLISMARRQRDVKATKSPLELLSEKEQGDYSDKYSEDQYDAQKTLRKNFKSALHELGSKATKEDPIVLLLDGCDEMWQAGSGTHYLRTKFPAILPTATELPEHVYIIMLGRPGQYIDWNKSAEPNAFRPLLQYEFTPASMARNIRDFLNKRADDIDSADISRSLKSEAPKYLRDRNFQRNVRRASGGAFGYAPLLMRQWLPNEATHDIETLEKWRDKPDSLPKGFYGIRARELLSIEEYLRTCNDERLKKAPRTRKLVPQFTEVLAMIAHIRSPMSALDFQELLVPESAGRSDQNWPPERSHLQAILEAAAQFFDRSSLSEDDATLQFGHYSLAEVAKAAWRLECSGKRYIEDDIADEASKVGSSSTHNAGNQSRICLTDDQRLQADAQLHFKLAEAAAKRWRDKDTPTPIKPWIKPGQQVGPAQTYALMWGPWHALTAAAASNAMETEVALGQRAMGFLIEPAYLQSAIRAGGDASLDALRQTYIAADKIAGADQDQSLRHHIESALLHWHEPISEGALQVGTLLWNLLGGWDAGKPHAEDWKTSLDQPALITALPGQPDEFVRRIHAVQSALTPCGKWLVTSGSNGTELWDLQNGWHRVRRLAQYPWVIDCLCARADQNNVAIAGIGSNRLVALGIIELYRGQGHLAYYAGHGQMFGASVDLHERLDVNQRHIGWAVASGSGNHGTVALLLQTDQQVRDNASKFNGDDPKPNLGQMAFYRYGRPAEPGIPDPNTGITKSSLNWHVVTCIALQACLDVNQIQIGWAVASGFHNGTVALLLQTDQQVQDCANNPSDIEEAPHSNQMALYVHEGGDVTCIALQARLNVDQTQIGWAVASGYSDGTVALLLQTDQQVRDCASKLNGNHPSQHSGQMALYAHESGVTCIAIQANLDVDQTQIGWAVASGFHNGNVRLLVKTEHEVNERARNQKLNRHVETPNPGPIDTNQSGMKRLTQRISKTIETLQIGKGFLKGTKPLSKTRSHHQFKSDSESVALYAHEGSVTGIALQARLDRNRRQVGWAVASGCYNGTVGLVFRSAKDALINESEPNFNGTASILDQTSFYKVPAMGSVKFIGLHSCLDANQHHVRWGVVCGSGNESVGLLLQSDKSLQTCKISSNGQLARYRHRGHKSKKIILQTFRDEQGQIGWAVASNGLGTLGLLLQTDQEVRDCANNQNCDDTSDDSGAMAIYLVNLAHLNGLSLQACLDENQHHIGWAVACSGSLSDDTDIGIVGLLLQSNQQVRHYAHTTPPGYAIDTVGQMAFYTHKGWVSCIALQSWLDENNNQIGWAVASGCVKGTVSLLLQTGQEVDDCASNPNPNLQDVTPAHGQITLYAHDSCITDISLQSLLDANQKPIGWAVTSSCENGTVGFILQTGKQLQTCSRNPNGNDAIPNIGRRASYCNVDFYHPLDLQPHSNSLGQNGWAVEHGYWDHNVRLLLDTRIKVPNDQLISCTRKEHADGNLKLYLLGEDQPRLSLAPLKNSLVLIWKDNNWLTCNSEASMIWSALAKQSGDVAVPGEQGNASSQRPFTLTRSLVCPYYVSGFEAYAVAQGDATHYAVAGALGNDVAILSMEIFTPQN